MSAFTAFRRNPGHWDILGPDRHRDFAIRGEPGNVIVRDERSGPDRGLDRTFKTVIAAMTAIADYYMVEPADGD